MEPTENTDRTNTPTSKPLASETPFFARFLEGQETESKLDAAQPGTNRATLKYPSDRDEWPDYAGPSNDAARMMTLKYPSDRDEDYNHSV
jgi:hypothetical protein